MRCATSSPIPTPAPCCPCSEQPPAERIFRREGFSVLSFLSEKEKKEPKKRNLNGEGFARKLSGSPPQKRNPNGEGFARKLSGSPPRSFVRVGGGERSFFSFGKRAKEPKKRKPIGVGDARKPSGSPPQKRNPNGEGFARKLSGSPPRSFVRVGGGERSFFSFGKRAKEPKKRNPIGEGDERKPSGSPPRSVRFPSIGRPPRLALPIFPCGAFLSEKPRKIFFTNERTRRRRADAAGQPKRVPGFLFWFSFRLRKEKRTEEKPRKIFLRANQTPPTGGRSGPTQAGSRLSFLVLFSFS